MKKCRFGCADCEVCAICQEEKQHGEAVFKLKCGHSFHTSCIVAQCASGDPLCPLCRKPISDASPDEHERKFYHAIRTNNDKDKAYFLRKATKQIKDGSASTAMKRLYKKKQNIETQLQKRKKEWQLRLKREALFKKRLDNLVQEMKKEDPLFEKPKAIMKFSKRRFNAWDLSFKINNTKKALAIAGGWIPRTDRLLREI